MNLYAIYPKWETLVLFPSTSEKKLCKVCGVMKGATYWPNMNPKGKAS